MKQNVNVHPKEDQLYCDRNNIAITIHKTINRHYMVQPYTHQASVHQSFHSRSSCPHENLGRPSEPLRSWRSPTAWTGARYGCPGTLWCSWRAARRTYLSADPCWGLVGRRLKWCRRDLRVWAHHSHSPGQRQRLDHTFMEQRLLPLTATAWPAPLTRAKQEHLEPQHLELWRCSTCTQHKKKGIHLISRQRDELNLNQSTSALILLQVDRQN